MSRIEAGSNLETDKYLIVDLNNIKDLDIQDSSEKENACKQISDFYVKIAHSFSVILLNQTLIKKAAICELSIEPSHTAFTNQKISSSVSS